MATIYQVERLRDGRSYSTRRITATQNGKAILCIVVSFHLQEQSTFDHQHWIPQAPTGEALTMEQLPKGVMIPEAPEFIRSNYTIDLRVVESSRYVRHKIEDDRVHVWIRAATQLLTALAPNGPRQT
ncbi:acyl-CoA thioesterase II [Bradyrhizobium sp. JR1.5]|uniref:acyl-CoA thioesterase n=1 Tax=unclassified Bradyrhizobium TaxID=2631580 RepID=UPI003398A283